MSGFTKEIIAKTFTELLDEKPMSKITVKDIVERCGVNRNTFYYHFKDIYDLVEWSCLEDATQALQGKKTYETWQEGLQQIFEAVLENKPFIMNVYNYIDRAQVEVYLTPLVDNLLMGVIEEESANISVRDEDKQFIARIYGYVFIGIMLDWIKDDMKEDPVHLVGRFAKVIQDAFSAALNRFKI